MRIHRSTRALTALVMAAGLVLAAAPALAGAPSPDWTKQFGSTAHDYANGVTVDGAGRIIVVGYTYGTVTGWPSRGSADAFVRQIKPNGKKVWTKQFGSPAYDYAAGVAVDRAGRIYVAGSVEGRLGATHFGGSDAFVRRLKPDGKKVWTRQFGTTRSDRASGIAVDDSGSVYVAGSTDGSLKGISKGSFDVFVRKYRPNGNAAWTRQFGTTTLDYAEGVAVDPAGNVYVVGQTLGSLGGTSKGSHDVFVRKYRPNGTAAWTRQFGTITLDVASDVAVDRNGNVYVTGHTYGSLKGSSNGASDIFVRKYRPNGTAAWTRQFGSTTDDTASGIAVDGAGRIYVVGMTAGSLKGTSNGADDVFVRKYRPDGSTAWTRQFGSTASDWASGVVVDVGPRAIVAGSTYGSVTGWPSRGGGDAFVRKYDKR